MKPGHGRVMELQLGDARPTLAVLGVWNGVQNGSTTHAPTLNYPSRVHYEIRIITDCRENRTNPFERHEDQFVDVTRKRSRAESLK